MRPKKILMIGGMPPPFQGQSIAFASAVEAVKSKYKTRVIDFSRRRKGIKSFLDLVFFVIQVPLALIIFRPDKVYFLCSRSFIGGLRDVYLLILFRISKAEIYNHLHGSDFNEYIKSRHSLFKKFIKFLYSRVKFHAVLIEGMQEQFQSIAKSDQVVIINNFFENFDQPIKIEQYDAYAKKEISICFLSSICQSKGVFDLIEAFKDFNRYQSNVKLKIAGSPIDDEFGNAKNNYEKLLRDVSSNHNIEYLGELDKTRKYELLKESDIFSLPSIFKSEAVPLAIIEAMAAGCVIVVYNHKYLPKLVTHKVNGFVTSTNTPKGLVESWSKIVSDYDMFYSVSNFNIKHARSNFSEEKYKAGILNFLSK